MGVAPLFLVLGAALVIDVAYAASPFNCDSTRGAVDIEHCPEELANANRASPDQLRTGYCMGGPVSEYIKKPCTKEDTEYVLARTKVVKGDKKFCSSLLTAEFTLFDLYLPHSVSEEEVKTHLQIPGGEASIYRLAGRFDINNDGKPENIGWIAVYSGAGSGCDIQRFVELDSKRAHIMKSDLTSLLAGESSCRDYYRAFRHRGKTYLENRQTRRLPHHAYVNLLKDVVELRGNERRNVCQFAYRPD